MPTAVAAILERQRERRFADLAGSRVDATLPVRQALVDELVATAIARHPEAELDARLLNGNRLEVRAGWRIFGFPARWRLPFIIDPHVNVAERPMLFLRLAESSAAWSAARRAIGGLGLLPSFLRISDQGVALDLRQLAQQRGYGDLLPIARALTFDGQDGILWMRVEAEVPRPSEVASSPSPPKPGEAADRASRAPRDLRGLIAHLTGARATIALKISEQLSNELLVAGLDGAKGHTAPATQEARSRRTPVDAQHLLGWCRDVRLAFDAGVLTVSAEVLVEAPAA